MEPRQQAILAALAGGMNPNEIQRHLGISREVYYAERRRLIELGHQIPGFNPGPQRRDD